MPSHDTAVVKAHLYHRGARYCQCLSTTFRTLASSSSQKHQLQHSLSYSKLLLRLAGDATVRATITADAQHVFSVYDFMDLACPIKCDSWTSVTWRGLIPEDSKFKDEIEFTMVTLKYVGVRNGNKSRNRKTPVMTLQELQHLLVILGGRVAAEFRQEFVRPQ